MNGIRTKAMVALLLLLPGVSAPGQDGEVPVEFRLIGTYTLAKRIKVRNGEGFPVAINPVDYRLYTDGITVRCYAGGGDAFTAFEIYRRDGITVSRPGGLVETVPGIQAKTFVGDVLRQMALSEERLTLTKFPALSDIVEITYASRVQQEVHQ